MTRVLITRPLPERVVARAAEHFDLELRERTQPMSESEMRSALALFDGVLPTLGDRFSETIFAEFDEPRCRILANFGVGYNHIDVAAAKARDITVTNTPGAVTDATADIGMMLILMACRRASEGERLVRAGRWEGWHPTQLLGLHVTGKRVGIVGFGRIGQAIGRRCHAGFGMEVGYFNRRAREVDFPAVRHELPDLAAWADVLVVTLPGSAETRHMIGAKIFEAMPPHARLVNVARGDIVDEAALIHALRTAEIAGAGLDVYEHEPQIPQDLLELEQVSLLPHLGTAALEVREAMGQMAVDNLIAFFDGTPVPNPV
ncbi:MAG: 2-hydroxyacid dehydrogenase [Rhodosalinus sp.]